MGFDIFYFALMLLTLGLALFTAFYSWRKRAQTGATTFAIFAALSSLTVASIILMSVSPDPTSAYVWMRIRLLSQMFASVCYTLFAIEYTGHTVWLSRRRVWIFFAIPSVSVFIFIRDFLQGHVFPDWSVERSAFLYYENGEYAGWYFAAVAYTLIIISLIMILLAIQAYRSPQPYRGQTLILLAVTVVSMILNLPPVLRNISTISISPLVISIIIRNLGIYWGLFHYKLLDIMPIAYREVFNNMRAGIIVLDSADRIVEINPAALTGTSLPRHSVIGQPVTTVFPLTIDPLERYHQKGETDSEISLAGRFLEIYITPLNRTEVAGKLMNIRDITKRKQADDRRERLIETLDTYAQTVAHDLKNPIALIFAHALLLEEDFPNAPPDVQKALQTIIQTSEKSAQVIDELLLFARVRSSDQVPKEPVEMYEVLESALTRLKPEITARQAQVVYNQNLPVALGYAAWIEEVWVNYITNALKYGGTPPRIEIGADVQGATVRFWVRDNGVGLTADEQQKLFQRFSRLEKFKSLKGHGLGLSIVHSIIEHLGGQVGVESQPGHGSTFYFTLSILDTTFKN